MMLPMIEELRGAQPDAYIAIAVPKNVASLLEPTSEIDKVYAFNMPGELPDGFRRSLQRSWDITREYWQLMRNERFDACILPRWRDDAFRSTVLTYLTQAPRRVGFAFRTWSSRFAFRDALLTEADPGGTGLHDPARFVLLIQNAGLVPSFDPTVVSSKQSRIMQAAARSVSWESLRKRFSIKQGTRLVVMAPGAGAAKRRWPIDKWASVAETLQALGFTIGVLSGKSDADVALALNEAIREPKLLIAGTTSLPETAAILEHAELYLGSDSGPGHIAGALGIPSVILFIARESANPDGIHAARRIRPLGNKVTCVYPSEMTTPCGEACGASEAHCILKIQAIDVIHAAQAALGIAGRSH